MHRQARKKFQTIGACVSAMIISPFLAGMILKGIPAVAEVAGKIAELTIGVEEKSNSLEITDSFDETAVLSEGLGWDFDEFDAEDEDDEQVEYDNTDVGEKPYPENLDNPTGTVTQTTYGLYSGTQFFNLDKAGQVRNSTHVTNQVLLNQSRQLPEFTIDLNGEPQVLIMHTHTTESFEPYERDFYDNSFSYRTTDPSKNTVMIGEEIKKGLAKAGINTIHDTTIHDYPSYNGSYERSEQTVKSYLEQYPSIKIVLDIHRDALESNNNLIQPVANINGKKAAQIMIISGCDDGTMGMPNYLQNFRLASLFQQQLEQDWSGLTRPILFDYRKYNQHLTTGSLLIEVGSHGNTLDQVKYSGELIGKSLAKALLEIRTQ